MLHMFIKFGLVVGVAFCSPAFAQSNSSQDTRLLTIASEKATEKIASAGGANCQRTVVTGLVYVNDNLRHVPKGNQIGQITLDRYLALTKLGWLTVSIAPVNRLLQTDGAIRREARIEPTEKLRALGTKCKQESAEFKFTPGSTLRFERIAEVSPLKSPTDDFFLVKFAYEYSTLADFDRDSHVLTYGSSPMKWKAQAIFKKDPFDSSSPIKLVTLDYAPREEKFTTTQVEHAYESLKLLRQ